jgi:hypothetical protein
MPVESVRRYAAAARHVLPRGGLAVRRLGRDDRLVFVVGSPRSGTTFLGEALGRLPGFVDLGEVTPLKAAIPAVYGLRRMVSAAKIRSILDRTRRLGLVTGLRGVEQTPEVAFVLPAALEAYPEARAVHLVRDGRDVVCSLLERGWLSAERAGRDDAGSAYGSRVRFWVEPGRGEEFEQASDATRAAWAWRAYVSAARLASERTIELRYEALVQSPPTAAEAIGEHLGVEAAVVRSSIAGAHAESIGRFRRDLSPSQLADVEREAGDLLRELGYS